MRKNKLRTVPITNGFMKKTVNDLLYGYLQCISYIDEDKRRFCYEAAFSLSDLVRQFDGKFSKSKLHRDMNTLISMGFLDNGTVKDLYDKESDAYLLPFNTQENIYKFLPLETLKFMVKNLPMHSIKIYVYLKNKFDGFGTAYNFTKKELINELGVKNPKQADYKLITDVLSSLQKYEIIQYSEFYQKYGKIVTPKHRLLAVNSSYTLDNKEEEQEPVIETDDIFDGRKQQDIVKLKMNTECKNEIPDHVGYIPLDSILDGVGQYEEHQTESIIIGREAKIQYGNYSDRYSYSYTNKDESKVNQTTNFWENYMEDPFTNEMTA